VTRAMASQVERVKQYDPQLAQEIEVMFTLLYATVQVYPDVQLMRELNHLVSVDDKILDEIVTGSTEEEIDRLGNEFRQSLEKVKELLNV
jgi:hypothetical protein